MRVCAALAWYDEPVEFLDRCVRSLAGLCDSLVALDGAWHLFEGGPCSPAEQAETIYTAAAAAGVAVDVIQPFETFESQVAKRAELMEIASDSDWVFVIDGDEYIADLDATGARAALAETDLALAFVGWRNLNQGESMPGTTPHSGLNRRLFRAGTTVRTVHSGYWYDGRSVVVTDEALDLRDLIVVEHDNVNRGPERNQRARMYRARRDATAAEKWVTLA